MSTAPLVRELLAKKILVRVDRRRSATGPRGAQNARCQAVIHLAAIGMRYRRRLWKTGSTQVTLYSGPRVAKHIDVDVGNI